MTPPTRRDVLRMGAGAAAGACAARVLGACGRDAMSAPAHPTPVIACLPGEGATVVAARGTDLGAMTRAALAGIGGIDHVVRPGETVFVKPNMVSLPWADARGSVFHGGECTKPEILVAVAEECLKAGARSVTIGDGSQMPTFDWSRAVTLDGSTNLPAEAARLTARYGRPVRLACLDAETPEWVEVPVGTSLGSVVVSSLVTEADRVISVPVAKTHSWAHLTLSLKNFIGITPLARYGWHGNGGNVDRALLHQHDPRARDFGRLFIDLAKAAKPDLAIIDMSIGLEGNGPTLDVPGARTVDMRTRLGSWLLLASTDATAADATAARVLGLESPYVDQILVMARAAGLGAICESAIKIQGATLDELKVTWAPAHVALA